MDDTTTFGNLTRVIAQFNDEFTKAKAEKATSETLIASAEYELEQVKEAFARARLDAGKAPIAVHANPAAFAEKFRKAKPRDEPADVEALKLAG